MIYSKVRRLASRVMLAGIASALGACVADNETTSSSEAVSNSSAPVSQSSAPTSSSANSSVSSSAAFVPPPEQTPGPPALTVAINAGGPAASLDGIAYQADAYFSGGSTYVTDADIAGTDEDDVYLTERYEDSSYAIPVENGRYNIRLNFSETYHDAVGERLFNVLVEGQQVLSNVDIFATVGMRAAMIENINNIAVTDGSLDIEFQSVAALAKVTGIVVYKVDTTQSHADTGKAIFDARCLSCHSPATKGVGTRADESGHDMQSLTATIEATMPPPGLGEACDAECSYYTAKYIASVNPFFERPIPGPEPEQPIADIAPLPPVMSRLSKLEYNNTVRDLFGIHSNPADQFPADLSGQFDNDNATLSVTSLHIEKFAEAAENIATEVVEAAANGNRSVINCEITNASCAQTVINELGVKVWRRPLSNEESGDLLALYNDVQGVTGNRATSMTALLRTLLFSPNFLYRPEFDQNLNSTDAQPLSAYELASRLSYFLWASTPDEPLLDKAADGSLLNDATIRSEVARMLADPRSETLVDSFAMTWLDFNRFLSHSVDLNQFPQYTDEVKVDLLAETRNFLHHIVRDDRPLAEILDANYTYLNERVANYYGVQGVSGNHFRMYEWPEGSQRKGLMGHAAALTAHSHPAATSPVKRGTWVMDRFLCDRPPEPSADVISQFPDIPSGLDPREISELHKESSAVCASCHAYVDPIGYGMENFNPVGLWRDRYTVNNRTVDSSAELPNNGGQFSSLTELADILATKGEVSICSIGYAMSYALGRRATTVFVPGISSADYPAVYDIYQKTLDSAHSMHDVFTEIALSPAFRTRLGANSGSQQPQ
ncbi:MAG TPA: DUF1592 domain-containing protein [Marinagarivorans sp.]